MKAVKKCEIITGQPYRYHVIDLLEENDVSGYTFIDNVKGMGERGLRDGDGLSDAFRNCYILVCFQQTELDRFQEPLRTMLERNGGFMLVTDAHWLIHRGS